MWFSVICWTLLLPVRLCWALAQSRQRDDWRFGFGWSFNSDHLPDLGPSGGQKQCDGAEVVRTKLHVIHSELPLLWTGPVTQETAGSSHKGKAA